VIGVVSKPGQVAVVEEFFELFKTPWEMYVPGRTYDVVIVTTDEVPEADCRLLVAYGAGPKSSDLRHGVMVQATATGGLLETKGARVPIYGELATLRITGSGAPFIETPAGTAGARISQPGGAIVLRVGYDLFEEVRALLTTGQPVQYAQIPTLDIHIRMLRNWILDEELTVLEVPPAPAGCSLMACLTHDIDFVAIRDHKFDHTMFGFLYRATFGALRRLLEGRISFGRFLACWRAAASLPLVHLGWAKDFWAPFPWYLQVEKGIPATYFLIPFKRHAGDNVPGKHASRRATAYDAGDIRDWAARLLNEGCELGVHGIDSWHSVEKGKAERDRLAEVTGKDPAGTRAHWLLNGPATPSVLEQSGYAYDSTCGFNHTVGYLNGTTQAFRPIGATTLLELPMHIQDGALFYPDRMNLSEAQAETLCSDLIAKGVQYGGVLTLLWHDRSHGPERFWGDFYVGLLRSVKKTSVWFGSAGQVVNWFRQRRSVRFETAGGVVTVQAPAAGSSDATLPPLALLTWRRVSDDRGPRGTAGYESTEVFWSAAASGSSAAPAGPATETSAKLSEVATGVSRS